MHLDIPCRNLTDSRKPALNKNQYISINTIYHISQCFITPVRIAYTVNNQEASFVNNNSGNPDIVYLSVSRDSVANLAFEEYLLTIIGAGQSILFLYENDASVIVGRFQNPWKECRTGLARRNRTPIRRRISGGGTVIHGPGNLNYSVITGRPTPEKDLNLSRIIRAMASLGVQVQRNDRYDLLIQKPDGLFKVSGSAFRQASGVSMHHGTLLIDADLNGLRGLLHTPSRDLAVKGVASNPSPVANLSEQHPGLKVSGVVQALSREWGAPLGPEPINPLDFESLQAFHDAAGRLVSEEWVWGKTPPFTERFSGLPGMDGTTMSVSVREGRIADIAFQSADEKTFTGEVDRLKGCRYHGPDIVDTVGTAGDNFSLSMAAIVDGDGEDGIFLP